MWLHMYLNLTQMMAHTFIGKSPWQIYLFYVVELGHGDTSDLLTVQLNLSSIKNQIKHGNAHSHMYSLKKRKSDHEHNWGHQEQAKCAT